MGALAEYEREIIVERTSLGRQIALEKVVKFGLKSRKLPMAEIMAKIDLGVSKSKIVRDYKIHRSTLKIKIDEYQKKEEKALQMAMRFTVPPPVWPAPGCRPRWSTAGCPSSRPTRPR